VSWEAARGLNLRAAWARVHQFAQSLRNPESVVGNVFPADLYVGAGTVVPVARSDLAVVSAELRPRAGVRLGAQAWERRLAGLVLVAPRGGEPFATAGFVSGTGRARGVAMDAGLNTARLAAVASYGVQRVRYAWTDTTYAPEHGATQLFEAGLTLFPSATSAVRVGATAVLGRRATVAAGGFEWEACNLRDRGCEFSGSPSHAGESLGAARLPAYARVDVGIRKHWHLDIGSRSVSLAMFGTVTNVFGRGNVLTLVRDAATGTLSTVDMRPLAPLVVGLDWQF
jgi:hypothetical protein